jgi:sulfur relay (sulfurtransferase) complex TusBCD TusD component (DsrE family)
MGILVSVGPPHPNFNHGLALADAALNRGLDVYLYCIDEAVRGLDQPALAPLRARGLKLFACAYAAQRRHLPLAGVALHSGLGMLGDLVAGTDRFVTFN